MSFAYLDEYGIMKVISDEAFAKSRAKGAVLPFSGANKGGYPQNDRGKDVTVYAVDECYVDGNRNGGVKLDTSKEFPELAALYTKLS